MSSNPSPATAAALTRRRFRHFPVRSPLLREWSLFLGLREMFQFARCPPHNKVWYVLQSTWVAPLGDREISGCKRLPHAYRCDAASVVGLLRRGIHRLLILSCRGYELCSPRRYLWLLSVLGRPNRSFSGSVLGSLKSRAMSMSSQKRFTW